MEKDTREGVYLIAVGLVWATLWVLDVAWSYSHERSIVEDLRWFFVAVLIVGTIRYIGGGLIRYFFR
jgi:hypothetical protein